MYIVCNNGVVLVYQPASSSIGSLYTAYYFNDSQISSLSAISYEVD